MSDIITSIQQFPTTITVVESPLNVTISQGGIQGPPGVPGTGGSIGGTGTTTNITNINSGSGLFIFQTQIISGNSGQFITFPTNLGNNPSVVITLQNNTLGNLLLYQISGTTPTGYWIIFSDIVNDTGYFINTFASNSTGTGLATIVIPNNINGNIFAQNYISNSNLNLISNNNVTGIIISGNDFNLYGNTSGIAPNTIPFNFPVTEPIYGGTGAMLGKPVGWIDIFLSGIKYKLPYFQ